MSFSARPGAGRRAARAPGRAGRRAPRRRRSAPARQVRPRCRRARPRARARAGPGRTTRAPRATAAPGRRRAAPGRAARSSAARPRPSASGHQQQRPALVRGRGRPRRPAASRRSSAAEHRPRPATPGRPRRSASSAAPSRRARPPPRPRRRARRRAGARRAARGGAGGPGRWSPARRCARRRWRPTARRCRRRPARRSAPAVSAVTPAAHRGRGHLAPGDPGADPVGGEQRVDRPAAAGLAAAELVGALDGRRRRRAGVGAAAARREAEEAAEGELHRVAGWSRPSVRSNASGVAGHLVDDRGDGLLGDLGQLGAHVARSPRGSGAAPWPAVRRAGSSRSFCSLRTKCGDRFTLAGHDFNPLDGHAGRHEHDASHAACRRRRGALRDRLRRVAEAATTPLVPGRLPRPLRTRCAPAPTCAAGSRRSTPRPRTPPRS